MKYLVFLVPFFLSLNLFGEISHCTETYFYDECSDKCILIEVETTSDLSEDDFACSVSPTITWRYQNEFNIQMGGSTDCNGAPWITKRWILKSNEYFVRGRVDTQSAWVRLADVGSKGCVTLRWSTASQAHDTRVCAYGQWN